MFFIIFILFLALVLSLFFYKVKSGRFVVAAKIFRIVTVITGISVFAFWFVEKSLTKTAKNAVGLQVINKLPQPLDFYIIIKEENPETKATTLDTKHLGKIRPEYFRTDFLKMKNSNEFWVAGFLGKKNMVYFSQHSVPNKNMDQIIEVQNYINQSMSLSDKAKKEIEVFNYNNIKESIWIILDFILLFLNLALLLRRTK